MNEPQIRSNIGRVLRYALVAGAFFIFYWSCHMKIGRNFEVWGPGAKNWDSSWCLQCETTPKGDLIKQVNELFMKDTTWVSVYVDDGSIYSFDGKGNRIEFKVIFPEYQSLDSILSMGSIDNN